MKAIPLSKRELLDAIREGVFDAMWAVATNRTMAPCTDFYDSIQDGVEAGIKAVHQGRADA